jgi:hypothetical protein
MIKRIGKKLLCTLFGVILIFVVAQAHPARAFDVEVCGKPLTLSGYIKQNVGYNVYGDVHDTKEGVENAFFEFLLEAAYSPTPNLKLFASGRINTDWTYNFYAGNNEWREKEFSKSKDLLSFFDKEKDLLHEANITWAPGNFYLRLGKQVVKWGQTDGFRLMDQINPIDQRRGMLDIEFESNILPIWLLRSEYKIPVNFMDSLSLQFIFNPNVSFRRSESIDIGNDVWGTWSARKMIPFGGPYPFDYAYIGSPNYNIHDPHGSDGFEYAFKITGTFWDSVATLNYYYGREKDAIYTYDGRDTITISPWDQRMIIHPGATGYYPLMRFVGGTFSRDIPMLNSTALGGVAPTFRVETFYAFSNTFRLNNANRYHQSDELRFAAGADWKVKVDFLNPMAYFMISPQWYVRRIMDFPENDYLWGTAPGDRLYENNYIASVLVNTTYLHTKLKPSFFYIRNWTNRFQMYKVEVAYEPNNTWRYALGGLWLQGDQDKDLGLATMSHKDQVYASIKFRF